MAYNSKVIQKLISRPEAVSPKDFESEQEPAMNDLESLDLEDQLDEEIPETEELASSDTDQAMSQLLTGLRNNLAKRGVKTQALVQKNNKYEELPESKELQQLKKLKAGEPLDDMAESDVEDISADSEAPIDLRKKALQKIKQKYLGQ